VLLIHWENDLRCRVKQAEQFYAALGVSNIPVEFVRFPNDGHGLSWSGQPWHRMVCLEKILELVEKHLETTV
jgi:dipeptidyl aminopeptidase/acylaminoacyl peptidase